MRNTKKDISMDVYGNIIKHIEEDSLSTYDMLYLEREFNRNKHRLKDETVNNNFRLSAESMVGLATELKLMMESDVNSNIYNTIDVLQSECYGYIDTISKLKSQLKYILDKIARSIDQEGNKLYLEHLSGLITTDSKLFNEESKLVSVKDLSYENLYNKNTNIGQHIYNILHKVFRHNMEQINYIYTSEVSLPLLLKYLYYIANNEPFELSGVPVVIDDRVITDDLTIEEYVNIINLVDKSPDIIYTSLDKIIDYVRNLTKDIYLDSNDNAKIETIILQLQSISTLNDKLRTFSVNLSERTYI